MTTGKIEVQYRLVSFWSLAPSALSVYGAEIVGRITDRDTKLGIGGALVRAVPQQKNQPEVVDKTDEEGNTT